jgi:hypothetical protein
MLTMEDLKKQRKWREALYVIFNLPFEVGGESTGPLKQCALFSAALEGEEGLISSIEIDLEQKHTQEYRKAIRQALKDIRRAVA